MWHGFPHSLNSILSTFKRCGFCVPGEMTYSQSRLELPVRRLLTVQSMEDINVLINTIVFQLSDYYLTSKGECGNMTAAFCRKLHSRVLHLVIRTALFACFEIAIISLYAYKSKHI